MNGVPAQPGRVLLEPQLLAPQLPSDRVVVVACFLTNQEHGLNFFLTFTSFLCHRIRSNMLGIGPRLQYA